MFFWNRLERRGEEVWRALGTYSMQHKEKGSGGK